MGNNNKIEKKKINTSSSKKIDAKTFLRIKKKFREYYKVLFSLIFIYVVVYLLWLSSADGIANYLKQKNACEPIVNGQAWTKRSWLLATLVILFQGAFFCLDGFVTSLLKAPFNQMCYTVNKADGLSDKKKDYIITKATESNEHCKETLKKFGILAISGELIRVFIQAASLLDKHRFGEYAGFFAISYLIPLTFAALSILSINRELKRIEKTSVAPNEKSL